MRYPNGHEFEYKYLRPSQIEIDPLYQRRLRTAVVDNIVKEFNGDTFNEPKVSNRDGKYWVFDGQHTLAAWRKMNGNEDKPIYCKVFKGMTWLDECKRFIVQDGFGGDPNVRERLSAAYEAREPDVIGMVKGAELVGFKVNFKNNKNNKTIVAVNALYAAFNKLGADVYVEMLTAIRDAWNYDTDSMCAPILNAMALFYKTYGGNFKRGDLVNSLKRVTPMQIIREGRTLRMKNGFAREIVKSYNKGRKYKLDIEKL